MAPDSAEPALTIDDITIGHILQGNPSQCYTVLEFLGEGTFGKVAKCLNVQTNELVAVKILFKSSIKKADKEASVLEALRVLDSEAFNVVKFFGKFEHRGLICLVFEMMEINVIRMIESQELKRLAPCDIRPIAKQLLVTLQGLKGLRLIHTDLKLDNIMLPKVKEQPLRVKVIDFGEAMYCSEVRPGMLVQPCGSRAPEVFLGNKFNESIDVFTLGCELASLYLGYYLFPVNCNYQMVKRMVEILGYPPNKLLSNGIYTRRFFKRVYDEETGSKTWILRTHDEYEQVTRTKTEEYYDYGCEFNSLDDLVNEFPKEVEEEFEDRKALVDLLKGLLHPDPSLRLSPNQALQHCFITMSHLQNTNSSKYFEQSRQAMQVCPAGISKQDVPFEVTSTVPEEGTTTKDPPKDNPQYCGDESSNADDWCEARSPEAAKSFDRAQDSSDWDNGIPDEGQTFDSASWWEERYVFSTGLDKERSSDSRSLGVQGSDEPAHCAQSDDGLSDAGSDGFPDKEIKTSSDAWSQNATNTNGFSFSLSDLDTFSDDVGSDGNLETDRSSKAKGSANSMEPSERGIKYDALTGIWSAHKEEVETRATQEILPLDLLNRNAATVPERAGPQDKTTAEKPTNNVKSRDSLTGIRSTNREEAVSKSANINESQEFTSLDLLERNVATSVPETRADSQDNGTRTTSMITVQHTKSIHLPEPGGNDAPPTLLDVEPNMNDPASEDASEDPASEDADCCWRLLDMTSCCSAVFVCLV